MSEDKPAVKEESKSFPLPWMLLWGFSPALGMALAGVLMALFQSDEFGGVYMIALITSPLILLAWSITFVYQKEWGTGRKVVGALFLAVGAIVVNFVLGSGACGLIAPPMNFH